MRKTIFIWILAMFLLVSMANAYNQHTDLSDAELYYSLDGNMSDVTGNGNTATNNSCAYKPFGVLGGSNACVQAESDYITTPITANGTDWTWSLWFNHTVGGADDGIILGKNGNIGFWLRYVDSEDNFDIYMGENHGGGYRFLNVGSLVDLKNNHMVVVFNGSTNAWTLYQNGVSLGNLVQRIDLGTAPFLLGSRTGGAPYPNGLFDEVGMWERSLNNTEVQDLYNSGVGINWSTISGMGAPPPTDTLNMSLPYPRNNTQYSTNTININATVNSSEIFECSLWGNWTGSIAVNQTITGYAAGNNIAVSFDLTTPDSWYNYTIGCNNTVDSENATWQTFFLDAENPTEVDNFGNNSVYYKENITAQFNITDNIMLHSYNISIDGNNIQGNNSIGTTSLWINFSYLNSSWLPGEHTLTLRWADGHTAQELGGEYDWNNGIFNQYMKYRFYDKGFVKSEKKDGSWFDSWKTERLKDRYTQTLTPAIPSSTITIVEESDMPIYIYDSPGNYGGKWVVMGNHWKDYVLEGETNTQINIVRINDYKVEVTISGIKNKDVLKFNSIGDLNVVEKNYTFVTTNATVTYQNLVSEKQSQTILFNISTPVGITTTDGALVWNGSHQTVVKTSQGDYDLYSSTFDTPDIDAATWLVNFTWSYNVSSLNGTESGSILNNQTITQIGVDNCSTYDMIGLNLTVRRDDTEEFVATNIGAYVQVFFEDLNNFRPFNLTWSDVHHAGICINPNSSNYTIYSQIEYGGTDAWATETHYLTNFTITNQTEFVDLYLTPNSTVVTFSVTDQDDNVVPNVFINVLRYDFDTNSHITTEILETDEQGEALGNIVLTTQWYKFLLVYQGATVLETDPVKITGTERNFRINLRANFFDFMEDFDGVQTDLKFTNSTLNFAYTFLNTEGTSVTACLKVIERSAVTDLLVNETCVSSSGGTILVNIGTPGSTDGKSYMATGTIQVNPTDVTDILWKIFGRDFKRWGQDGIFVAMFVRMGLALIGVWNPMVALILLLFADVAMIWTGLYHLGTLSLIFYIILGLIAIYRVNRK